VTICGPDAELMTALQDYLGERGATFVACADLGGVPAEVRQGLDWGVTIGVALDAAVIAGIGDGPTPVYAAEYDRANALLNELARIAAEFLRARGHRAVPLAATVKTLDKATLATPLPHKTAARLAGVGWIGKCALLITRSHGSAVRYNTVLTDASLPVGMPADVSECGPCTACVDACPAGAPLGRAWEPGMKREELFDAFACCAEGQRRSAAAGIDSVICGICIAACPHTKRYIARSLPAEASPPDQKTEA
jgi:epoxyqueuosine reductase QueG